MLENLSRVDPPSDSIVAATMWYIASSVYSLVCSSKFSPPIRMSSFLVELLPMRIGGDFASLQFNEHACLEWFSVDSELNYAQQNYFFPFFELLIKGSFCQYRTVDAGNPPLQLEANPSTNLFSMFVTNTWNHVDRNWFHSRMSQLLVRGLTTNQTAINDRCEWSQIFRTMLCVLLVWF